MKFNTSTASGSLIVLISSLERASLIQKWISEISLHSDTAINQIKDHIKSPKFWILAALGFVTYKPHQLRQEIIILDIKNNSATSTASPRISFEFGFSLQDLI